VIQSPTIVFKDTVAESRRVAELFNEQQQNTIRHTSRLFSWLMTAGVKLTELFQRSATE
jgi:hypothetical protein